MKIREVGYHRKFIKNAEKLPDRIKQLLIEREAMFRLDIYNPILKTHKLSGRLGQFWSFSLNYSYRVVFEFVSEDEVIFINVGTHEIYK